MVKNLKIILTVLMTTILLSSCSLVKEMRDPSILMTNHEDIVECPSIEDIMCTSQTIDQIFLDFETQQGLPRDVLRSIARQNCYLYRVCGWDAHGNLKDGCG